MTYSHDGTGACSLIDFWVLCVTEGAVVETGNSDPLNLSDHVHLTLHIQLKSIENVSSVISDKDPSLITKLKIRWDKCDVDFYSNILRDSLQPTLLCQLHETSMWMHW